MFGFFRWIRERVTQAIIGGFSDAADRLDIGDDELRARLADAAAGKPPAPVLPPAEPPDDAELPAGKEKAGRRK